LGCLILLVCLALPPGTGRLAAEDWPHWRGPRRDGIVAEDSGWKAGAWPLRQPLWTGNVGEGGTSPLVAGGKVYALGWKGGRDTVRCLDAATGEEVWASAYASPQYGRHHEGDEGIYSGPCSTPEYDPETGLLYTLGIDGDLRCWDTKAGGKEVGPEPLRPLRCRPPSEDRPLAAAGLRLHLLALGAG
jgi:outer membrane protein assembly factor BamB